MTLRRVLFVSTTAVAITLAAMLPTAVRGAWLLLAGWSLTLGPVALLLFGALMVGVIVYTLRANTSRLYERHQERNPLLHAWDRDGRVPGDLGGQR